MAAFRQGVCADCGAETLVARLKVSAQSRCIECLEDFVEITREEMK